MRSSALAVLAIILAACDGSNPVAPKSSRGLAGGPLRSASVVPAVDVYVSAHQDDWLLFIGDHFATSVKGTAGKVVVIYTTAGDGNRGSAYWAAREAASKAAVDTIAGTGAWTCAAQTVNAHPIQRCVKGKVISYYMRMPDGNLGGDGFGHGSLKLLQGGQPTAAINGSTTYASWSDFTTTLRTIIANEAGANTSPYVQVNAPEYDRTLNPGDHDDHWRTGDATRDAAAGRSWDLGWYVGYNTSNKTVNVSGAALNNKKAEFWQYSESMGEANYGSPWGEAQYQGWLQRTYVRYVNYIPPTPPVAPSNLAVASHTFSNVTLTWTDNSADESLFRLQRAPDASGVPGTWADVASTAPNAVSYVDATILPATAYWYRVRSESNGGVSAYTTAVAVTTDPPPPPPATPTNLQATGVSGSRIDLTWSDVATNEASYELERAPDAGGAPGTYALIATLAPNTTAYNNLGLQPNTQYWYRLRAVNPGGPSAYVTASASTSSAFDVDVYVAAYEDDWQLFMGDRVNASLQTAQRVVLIYTTAGDQGQNSLYWTTREKSSRAGVDTLIGAGAWTCATQTVAGRPIQRCEKGKVVAYYMRMPDGLWGDGFGHGSLTNLKSFGTATAAIDNSTTYATWSAFTSTLQAIITTETGGQPGPFAEINSPDYDPATNVNDMPDRYLTGQAVQAASQGQRWDLAWYVGKNSQNMAVNVSGAPYNKKVEAYRATDQVMINGQYGTGWFEVQGWLPRTYYRFVPGQ
jgi:hypothetical protein